MRLIRSLIQAGPVGSLTSPTSGQAKPANIVALAIPSLSPESFQYRARRFCAIPEAILATGGKVAEQPRKSAIAELETHAMHRAFARKKITDENRSESRWKAANKEAGSEEEDSRGKREFTSAGWRNDKTQHSITLSRILIERETRKLSTDFHAHLTICMRQTRAPHTGDSIFMQSLHP